MNVIQDRIIIEEVEELSEDLHCDSDSVSDSSSSSGKENNKAEKDKNLEIKKND